MLIPFRNKKKWGFSNAKKDIIIECQFDDVEPFSKSVIGFARIKKNDKFHWIDKNQNLYPIDFFKAEDYISPFIPKVKFEPIFISFEVNNKRGFKDVDGNIIIKPEFWWCERYRNGAFKVGNIGEFWHKDINGNDLYPRKYSGVSNFNNGIALVYTGKIIGDPTRHSRWGNDYYIPSDTEHGYIDLRGNEYWND